MIWRVHQAFDRRFERFRARYRDLLDLGAGPPRDYGRSLLALHACVVSGCSRFGQNFFPYVDAGQMRLHVRCPTGTRIEEAERIFAQSRTRFAESFRPRSSISILDNIGLPNSGINLAFSDSATHGDGDGEILISLRPKHQPTPTTPGTPEHGWRRNFPLRSFSSRLPTSQARFSTSACRRPSMFKSPEMTLAKNSHIALTVAEPRSPATRSGRRLHPAARGLSDGECERGSDPARTKPD